MSKHVTVTSNAAATPSLDLTIFINYVACIKPSVNFISLFAAPTDSARKEFTLTSDWPRLTISSVRLVTNNAGTPLQNGKAYDAGFTIKKAPEPTKDGLWVYSVAIALAFIDKTTVWGNVVFKTNHPRKPALAIESSVEERNTGN
jgi:hypothetical protein